MGGVGLAVLGLLRARSTCQEFFDIPKKDLLLFFPNGVTTMISWSVTTYAGECAAAAAGPSVLIAPVLCYVPR